MLIELELVTLLFLFASIFPKLDEISSLFAYIFFKLDEISSLFVSIFPKLDEILFSLFPIFDKSLNFSSYSLSFNKIPDI